MQDQTISVEDVNEMIVHWLNTSTNSYLGSGYGQDIKSLLQLPSSDNRIDDIITKLINDIPLLNMFSNSINIYKSIKDDKVNIILEFAGQQFNLSN